MLIYINYDADAEFWSGIDLSWPLGWLPNTGGLEGLINDVQGPLEPLDTFLLIHTQDGRNPNASREPDPGSVAARIPATSLKNDAVEVHFDGQGRLARYTTKARKSWRPEACSPSWSTMEMSMRRKNCACNSQEHPARVWSLPELQGDGAALTDPHGSGAPHIRIAGHS